MDPRSGRRKAGTLDVDDWIQMQGRGRKKTAVGKTAVE
jgi:hypothetical protein